MQERTKIQAKMITSTSFMLYTESKEKLGLLVDYSESEGNSGFELFGIDSTLRFDSLQHLENDMNFELVLVEEKEKKEQLRNLNDYPVNDTDSIIDIEYDAVLGISTFRKSERSKKRFYPGWWIVKSKNGIVTTRLSISTDTYSDADTEVLGPYKTYMEVTYNLKKM